MFVALQLLPSGQMLARCDTIGFDDDVVAEINASRASREQIDKVNEALKLAAQVLYHTPVTGRPC